MNIIIEYNEDTGTTVCVITDNINNITLQGYGMAKCHDNDKPFQNKITGEYIAKTRAQIDILRKKRDYDIKPGLLALKHLKATMINSKNYNSKNYENKRLNKEIKHREDDIHYLNMCIKEVKNQLKIYIDAKDSSQKAVENR